jgi:drug/metabolite transporter (DMT)-like permease
LSFALFLTLLAAAALHAGWNVLVRRDADRSAAAIAVAGGGTVVGLLLVPFLPAMELTAIPYVLASSSVHILYYALIASAYRHGELSVVYPIMRGVAPVIVTLAGMLFIELPSWRVLVGVLVVALGIVSLGADGWQRGRAGIGAALANAAVIAGYTLVDGLGARTSAAPATYTAWLIIGGGIATVGWQFIFGSRAIHRALMKRIPLGLAGGAMGFGAYAIALWAMTVAPIGAVAAVRESSVLFATAFGAAILHERFGRLRWAAAALVVAGLALVKSG